ncbi:MAG TPA: Rne/Rng family ribonuclease [Tepidisphaeraceae bacterium]|jgi:ribonuclease E|nr:Rne/Rng family ribonuclease [Tepidisphaeraceae bacterium]
MAKDMLINVSEGEECRIALVEDGALEELYMERTSSTSHVGNVYKGKVMNVEPSIQAAFVDFGLGRNGFLHISDLLPSYFGRKGDDVQEFVGKKMARRDRPPIQRCLRRGDEIVVQVIKEGIGTKGPTLSAYLSISGKMLVMMPGVNGRGVSRKIEDEDERRRLKQILDQLDPPDDCGFIIRTESVGKSKAEIERDLKYLARLWEQIKKKRDGQPSPVELYTEGDLVTRTVRDVFSSDVERIIIDNEQVADRVSDVIKLSNPRAKNKVELYEGPLPLFHKYGIEREIEQMYSRHVPLKSGGSLVIDSTEAIVAIDVNSGKFRDHSDAETTAFKIDMEAADEICRQLKLRDLGGVIIVDFIDLRYERHRRELEERLEHNLKHDRAKTKVLHMSQFGIIEMTRQRMRPSLKRSVYFDCPHCKGAGLVKTPESMSLDVMRRLAIGIHDARVVRVELSVNPDVSFYLLNKKRQSLARLEYDTNRRILIHSDAKLGLDEMRLELFDNRDGVVIVPELSSLQQVPHKTQLNTRPATAQAQQRGGRSTGGRPDDRQKKDQRPGQRPGQQQRHRPEEPEREEFDRDMEAIEDRADEFDRDDSRQGGRPDAEPSRGPRRPEMDAPGGRNADRGQRPAAFHGNNGAPRNEQDGAAQEGEGGKRRRRRRRRRGRGRGGPGEFQEGQRPAAGAGGDFERTEGPGGEEFEERDSADAQRPYADADRGYDDADRESGQRDERGELEHRDERDEHGEESGRFDERETHVSEYADRDAGEQRPQRDDMAGRGDHLEPPPLSEHADEDEERVEREDRLRDDRMEREAFDEIEDRKDREAIEQHKRGPAGPVEHAAEDVSAMDEKAVEAGERHALFGDSDSSAEPQGESADVTEQADTSRPKKGKGRGASARGGKKKPPAKSTRAKAETPKAKSEPKPKAARAPRGGKSSGGRKKTAPQAAAANIQSAAAPDSPVVRTGSSDRHLADEEPVLHEPVRRPRSHRDLDQIPDDYDD